MAYSKTIPKNKDAKIDSKNVIDEREEFEMSNSKFSRDAGYESERHDSMKSRVAEEPSNLKVNASLSYSARKSVPTS